MPARRLSLPLLALVLTFTIFAPAGAAIPSTQEDLNRVVGEFYGAAALDAGSARAVQNVTITKDLTTFTLKSGTLYLGKPLEGMVVTAVFLGEGTVSVVPVRPMDKLCLNLAGAEHLHKDLGGKLETSFNEMVLVSLDDTLTKMIAGLAPTQGGDATHAAEVLKDRLDHIDARERDQFERQGVPLDISFAEKMTGSVPQGPLVLHFKSADHGWLEYIHNTMAMYEVQLSAFERVGAFWEARPLLVTHRLADLDPNGRYVADAVKDQKDQMDITQEVMEITIPDTNHFLVEADVHFVPLAENLRSLRFDLINQLPTRTSAKGKPLRVVKVTDAAGQPLPYMHYKDTALVLLPSPPSVGSESKVHFSLDEETIVQLSSVHYRVLNTYPWFPQYGYLGGRYRMDWTIKAKKPLRATGSGRTVREDESDHAYNVTELAFDTDVQFPSLIFGQYQKLTDVYTPEAGGTKVDLAVFSWPSTSFYVMETDDRGAERTNAPRSVEITVPGGKPKDILAEAKEIIKFGEGLYGPFPYGSLNVAQMSPGLGFGQAPPGLVQLTGEAFMSSAQIASAPGAVRIKGDFLHEFFAHEMGHQWWGHVIPWATDEDVWLSESYAEYTSGLYVMALLGQERFQGKLKDWRDRARIADPHAPIAWANNVRGLNAQNGQWRTGLIYNKGPYVVHMLRMQVGHDNFVKAMKAFTAKYRFTPATTDDLKREFEAVVGYKLDFFFDQWFRGTGIPTFDYATDVKQSEDGKWVATVKISQRDKQNVKIVSMPVFFHFGKDKVVVKERPILKAEDVYQVKLPEKPDKITLDDYRTLLADIVSQDAAGY